MVIFHATSELVNADRGRDALRIGETASVAIWQGPNLKQTLVRSIVTHQYASHLLVHSCEGFDNRIASVKVSTGPETLLKKVRRIEV